MVHGLGAHGGRMSAMGGYFLAKGIASYAAELGDFGDYINKIVCLRGAAAKEHPGKKIFLVGESLGAVMSFIVCAKRPGLFSGLICMSPAFEACRKMGPLEIAKILPPLFFDPQKKIPLPFDSSMCTRDIEFRKRIDEDPLEYRSVSSRIAFRIFLAQARAFLLRKRILVPTLFLIAGDDKLVNTAASKAVFDSLASKDKELVEFPGMYHSLSIELGKEAVFEAIERWVQKRI